MQLANGYYQLPPGKIANAVTWLELTDLTRPPDTHSSDLSLRRLRQEDAATHKAVYEDIGADWLWSGLLRKNANEMRAYLANPVVLSYAVLSGEKVIGLLDLEVTPSDGVEIVYFGFIGAHTGRGAGHWLMGEAIRIARAAGHHRLWLHTCNFDHPKAAAFYQKQGFRIYAQGFEIMDDPRRKGLLPREAAPHVPYLDGE